MGMLPNLDRDVLCLISQVPRDAVSVHQRRRSTFRTQRTSREYHD